MKRLLSIYDLTGNWSRPYQENGWDAWRIDLQRGFNIYDWDYRVLARDFFQGIIIAQPCTDTAISGAKHFERKDSDGSTYETMSMVYKSLAIVQYFSPGFWSLENPMSRIHKLVPELGKISFRFDPYEFAGYDPVPENSQYQKQTWLWGNFNIPQKKPMENLHGQKYFKEFGGKSQKTKNERSKTPLGFAYAFYESNN
jgi:hypothetical protein